MTDYLEKHKLKTKEDIAQHIIELKRNTYPDMELISSLCSYLFPAEKSSIPTDATDIEVFHLDTKDSGDKTAFIGFKISNGNFSFAEVPFTGKKSAEKTEKQGILNDHAKEILKGAGTKDHGEVKPNSTRHKAPVHCGGYDRLIFKDNPHLGENTPITPDQIREGIQKGVELLKTIKDNSQKRTVDVLEMGQIVGKKENDGKPQLSLLFTQFPKALEAVAKCSEYGHQKYKETDQDYLNYQRVEGGSKTYADAGLRHRAFPKGTTDIDSQLPHAYHVAWNALAELELILKNR